MLVDGMYPALTWIPFLLAGIIIGRSILNYKFAARVSATAGADRLRHQQGFTSLVLTGLALLERFAAPVLAPFKTLGKMPLTYYVAHVVGFLVLMITETTAPSLVLCLVFFIAHGRWSLPYVVPNFCADGPARSRADAKTPAWAPRQNKETTSLIAPR